MGPKGTTGKGGKRGKTRGEWQSSGSQVPFDAATQAAYLAADLAVQQQQEGQPVLPATGVPLGRTA